VDTLGGFIKDETALEYSTRVVQEGGRRCKKSTLNDLVHLTPLRIPLMNPSSVHYIYNQSPLKWEKQLRHTSILFIILFVVDELGFIMKKVRVTGVQIPTPSMRF
jgi:hypothetical protein